MVSLLQRIKHPKRKRLIFIIFRQYITLFFNEEIYR